MAKPTKQTQTDREQLQLLRSIKEFFQAVVQPTLTSQESKTRFYPGPELGICDTYPDGYPNASGRARIEAYFTPEMRESNRKVAGIWKSQDNCRDLERQIDTAIAQLEKKLAPSAPKPKR